MPDARATGGLLGRLRPKKPEPPRESGGEQRTLALAPLLEWLDRRGSSLVVDVGSAQGDNLTFFSGHGCRLEFLDLYNQLREVGQITPEAELERTRGIVARTLDLGASGPGEANTGSEGGGAHASIDLVLLWDLVNYLTVPQIEGLYQGLSPLLAPGTRAFLLLTHSPQLPLHPRRLRVRDAEALAWEDEAPNQRPCPRYSEHQLHKLFPDFEVERSFLMRHGVREYLLTVPESR